LNGAAQAALHERAAAATRQYFGEKVFVRAVVEVSNFCRENCAYCGMRRDNRTLARYRAQHEQIAELLIEQRPASVTDVNIQSGEDPVAVREVVLPLIETLRRETPLGISVCLGTLTPEIYDELQSAGASIFIMKFECGDAAQYEQLEAPGTLAERVAAVHGTALLFEPGTAWNYSNIGIAALGRIVEVVTSQPYDRFLAERIFQPLAMKDTFFFVPPDKANRVASVYSYEADGLQIVPMAPAKFPAPEGGLFSTAGDMARFHQMLLNKGTLDGQRILSAAAVEAMTTSQTGSMKAGFVPGVGHGFGFEVVRETLGTFRYNSVGSFVKGGAYRTYGWVDPAKDLVGIIFMQRTNGGGDMADEINSFMAMSAAAIDR